MFKINNTKLLEFRRIFSSILAWAHTGMPIMALKTNRIFKICCARLFRWRCNQLTHHVARRNRLARSVNPSHGRRGRRHNYGEAGMKHALVLAPGLPSLEDPACRQACLQSGGESRSDGRYMPPTMPPSTSPRRPVGSFSTTMDRDRWLGQGGNCYAMVPCPDSGGSELWNGRGRVDRAC